ncbi:MAG TPA: glycosyltransferase family 4 protein [Candidatus Dormibacteraeota bacterium]|nr:glycosyltransferase family 4 protein [Candidatus Dormibacteraeota bacterium]HEX2680335.1 glycosyltransferase family 4 protein [Candidatus Dormibacteraeota bacterium]
MAGVAKIQAELLRGAGHQVDQIELPMFGAAWPWPVKAVALPVRLAAYLPAVLRLRGGRYDVIHIHWLTQGVAGVLSGRRFFVQAHGSDLHLNLSNPIYRWFTRLVLNRATAIFYVTPNLKDYLRDYEGKIVYLPNPVDVQAIAPDPKPPTRVAKALIFTRLDPVKGVDRIFPAAEALSKLAEVTALAWGPLAASYAERYGPFVKFVPIVPHEKVGVFLQEFDLVIGQMQQGILSLMEIEALAAGRPLITGINRELYPDDSPPVRRATYPDEIVRAVADLKRDPSKLASEGREWVARNHGYEHHLDILEATYFKQA